MHMPHGVCHTIVRAPGLCCHMIWSPCQELKTKQRLSIVIFLDVLLLHYPWKMPFIWVNEVFEGRSAPFPSQFPYTTYTITETPGNDTI